MDIKLTKAQRRELDFLKEKGGWRCIFSGRLRNVYWELQKKGLVRLEGAMRGGAHAYLIDEKEKRFMEKPKLKWTQSTFAGGIYPLFYVDSVLDAENDASLLKVEYMFGKDYPEKTWHITIMKSKFIVVNGEMSESERIKAYAESELRSFLKSLDEKLSKLFKN